jgi:hypothetical protein
LANFLFLKFISFNKGKDIKMTENNLMIHAHFATIEKSILALAKIQDIVGHPIHKGIPREIFIKNFLETHLGKTVSFGTGEIIDANSKPMEIRNQHDIVIYRNEFPMLHLHGGINAFLAESVLATVEVKSTINYEGLKSAFKSAIICKNLKRNYFEGLKLWHSPPKIINFIIAYNGPQKMKTIYNWIKKLENELNFSYQEMPETQQERMNIPSPGIDGIYVLGKGFVHFDNFMISCVPPDIRNKNQWMRWIILDSENISLLHLFLNLAQAFCSYPQKSIQLISYLKEMEGKGKLQWGK